MLVGESPGRAHPRFPLFPSHGNSGDRLARALDMTMDEFLGVFDRVNLLPNGPWLPRVAEAYAANLAACLLRRRDVVLLGRRVATAFGSGGSEYLVWTESSWGGRHVVVPHPSGRWYNDEINLARVRDKSWHTWSQQTGK